MGRVRNSRRRTKKNKTYKKAHKTHCRPRDIDQVQDDLIKEKEAGKKMGFELDEDLPGGGQYYCTFCARHFADQATLEAHEATKVHKRR
jgi:Zinc-finger double-stranded RNA-binding